jgi:cytoskeletal protein RodZ
MKTVGTLLREARESKRYSLVQVEEATKIRAKFLTAMEADDFRRLPSPSIVRGFVHNYAEFLGLNSQTVLAFLRRQMAEVPKSSLLPKGMAEPINRSMFQLTPAKFLMFLVGGLIGVFLIYLGLQYRQIRQPPDLSLELPKDQLVISEKRVEVIGRTDPDATVMVNSVSVLVRSDGRFFDTVTLDPGVNTITIVATSRFGKTTTLTREIGYQP